MTSPPRTSGGRAFPWLVIAGVLVAALSLRGPVTAPTPVLREIEADLGIGAASAGLLSTLPVLMFAVMTPLAALVIRRLGAELALLSSLVGVLAGTLLRGLPGFGWMLVGSVVIGASITVGNVVVPVVIRRDVPPHQVATVTAAYVAMLNAGSLFTALLTAPLADAVGWSWALLIWAVMTLGGVAVWSVHLRRSRGRGDLWGDRYSGEEQPRTTRPAASEDHEIDARAVTGPMPVVDGHGGRSMLRRPILWLLLATFAGQTLMYFGLTTWLPTMSSDLLGLEPTAAGAMAAIFQGVAVPGAFLFPVLARYLPTAVPAAMIAASWLTVTIGVWAAPDMLWLWLAIGAIGHSGGFVVVFTVLVQISRSEREAANSSALVQGLGYATGAVGGPLLGAIHDATGGWDVVSGILVVVALAYTVVMTTAVAVARRS